jgi:signal transduction histidine kinase
LYQCRSIVRALGGDLTVESQEGVGTRMTVRLPAASRQEEQQAAGSRQLAEG